MRNNSLHLSLVGLMPPFLRGIFVVFMGLCFLSQYNAHAGKLVWFEGGLEDLTWGSNPVSICVVQKNGSQWRSNLAEVHQFLKAHHDRVRQSTGLDKNVVVAGLSFLTAPSREGQTHTGGFFEYTTSDELDIAAFVSGTTFAGDVPKGYAAVRALDDHSAVQNRKGVSYSTGELFEGFFQRRKRLLQDGEHDVASNAVEYWDQWLRNHERVLQDQKEKLSKLVTAELVTGSVPVQEEMTEETTSLARTVFSLHHDVRSVMAEGVHGASCDIGAIVDSEQILLRFLQSYPASRSVGAWQEQEDLFSPVFGPFLATLNKEKFGLKMKPSRPELDHYIKQQEAILHEVTALRGPIEERRFCGAIFHIHSTNEVCASCMEHLLYEFEHSEDFQDIRNKAKGLLYLIVTCDNDGLQDGPNRPGGGAKEVLEGSHDIFDLLGEEKYIQFKLKTTEQVSGKGRQSTLRARASSSAASSSSARN